MPTVFLDGRFIERGEAKVSAFDAGFQHGVGLFETMLAVRETPEPGGEPGSTSAQVRVVHLDEHLKRLAGSARGLNLSDSLRTGVLGEAVVRTADKAAADMPGVDRLRVRLTLTGGDLNMLERGRGQNGADQAEAPGQHPTLLIVAQPATAYPKEMFEHGTTVVLADMRINPLDPFQGHKTLSYWARLRELQVAAAKRAGESLVFQVTNHLAGGCVSNAILVKDGRLLTPIARGEEESVAAGDFGGEVGEAVASTRGGAVIPSPVLPGIVRQWALDWATDEGIEAERRMLTIDDVLGADELMLTNSSWGVLPVARVEAEAIGEGGVGPVTRRLIAAWDLLTA